MRTTRLNSAHCSPAGSGTAVLRLLPGTLQPAVAERELFDPTVAFESASLLEIHRPDDNCDVEFGEGRALKPGELHEAVAAKIRNNCHAAGDALLAHAQAALWVIEREYGARWSELRDTAKVVAEWERKPAGNCPEPWAEMRGSPGGWRLYWEVLIGGGHGQYGPGRMARPSCP